MALMECIILARTRSSSYVIRASTSTSLITYRRKGGLWRNKFHNVTPSDGKLTIRTNMKVRQPKHTDEDTPILQPTTHWKKGATGVRAWLLLDVTGAATVVEAGKHAIMRRTGLPARDLRILDPMLSYPSTVLGRERAIVISLEHIKAIITAHEVLLLNSKDPNVTPFLDQLQKKILQFHLCNMKREGILRDDDPELTDLSEPEHATASPSPKDDNDYSFRSFRKTAKEDDKEKGELQNHDGSKVLPFEFVALEACLEAACSSFNHEATTLEQEAHPALDKLTTKISTLNLERVRQIKSRLVAITGRVQKVRDELEHLLDDDTDMAEMYLTEKLIEQSLDTFTVSSINERDDIQRILPQKLDDRVASEEPKEEGDIQNADSPDLWRVPSALSRGSHEIHTVNVHSATTGAHLNVEELEMLLEAYFVHIDGTLNKLLTLKEYVDDTEDYINIMLDDKQNQLLQMGVQLSTASLVISAFVGVVGTLGMNIKIDLFNLPVDGNRNFLLTIGGCSLGCILVYMLVIGWCKHKQLL